MFKVFLFKLGINHRNISLVHVCKNDEWQRVKHAESGDIEILNGNIETVAQIRSHISIKQANEYDCKDNVDADYEAEEG